MCWTARIVRALHILANKVGRRERLSSGQMLAFDLMKKKVDEEPGMATALCQAMAACANGPATFSIMAHPSREHSLLRRCCGRVTLQCAFAKSNS